MVNDYRDFIGSIKKNPFQGSSLGGGVRKVRFGVADKGGGKSGGLRVITFTVNKIDDSQVEITLLYIYDKSEMSSVSDKFIAFLLKHLWFPFWLTDFFRCYLFGSPFMEVTL